MLYPYFIGKDGQKVARAHTMDESFVLSSDKPYYCLEEGLIRTYPSDIVCKTIARLFNLAQTPMDFFSVTSKKQGWIDIMDGHNETEQIMVYIYNSEENKKQLVHYFSKYGYFFAGGENRDGNFICLYFEKKYDIEVTEIVHKKRYLYHVCRGKIIGKVLSQGLTPRASQWGEQFKNPERVYLTMQHLSHKELESWAVHFNKQKTQGDNLYLLLRIDTWQIDSSIQFYYDSRLPDAVYTMSALSPKAIEIEDSVRLDNEEEA